MKRNFAPGWAFTFLIAAGLSPLLIGTTVQAADCGDNIAGTRVPCDCGDTVVTNTVLQPTDPVTLNRCKVDGLRLRAPRNARTISLNIAGLSIVGTGMGVGIRVIDGGEDGALIIGGETDSAGEVANFRNGVRATGKSSLAGIRDLVIKGCVADGAVIRAGTSELVRVVVVENGRNGLRIAGENLTMETVNASDNKGYGARVTGRQVKGNMTAFGNARGSLSAGDGAETIQVEATSR